MQINGAQPILLRKNAVLDVLYNRDQYVKASKKKDWAIDYFIDADYEKDAYFVQFSDTWEKAANMVGLHYLETDPRNRFYVGQCSNRW